jgi:hypothetical protein
MPTSISGVIIGYGLKTSIFGDYAKKCQQGFAIVPTDGASITPSLLSLWQ